VSQPEAATDIITLWSRKVKSTSVYRPISTEIYQEEFEDIKGVIITENVSSSPVFSEVLVTRSLVLRVTFCRSLPFLFLLVIVLSVLLRFANYDYPFDIFKLFLVNFCTNGTIYTSLFDLAWSQGNYICSWFIQTRW
jgi:hypothetical protein